METDNKNKAIEDNTNTLTGGLFHKLEDTNAPSINLLKT